MKATCRATEETARDVGLDQNPTFRSDRYALTIGDEYSVAGLGVRGTSPCLLVRDDTGNPCWCPIGLFTVEPQPVPRHWLFGLDLPSNTTSLLGYPALVRDPGHLDGLEKRRPEALTLFDDELGPNPGSALAGKRVRQMLAELIENSRPASHSAEFPLLMSVIEEELQVMIAMRRLGKIEATAEAVRGMAELIADAVDDCFMLVRKQ